MLNRLKMLSIRQKGIYLILLLTLVFTPKSYAEAECWAVWDIYPSTSQGPVTVPMNAPIGSLLASGVYSYAVKVVKNNSFGAPGNFVLQPRTSTKWTGIYYDSMPVYKTSKEGVGIAYRTDARDGLLDVYAPQYTYEGYLMRTNLEYFLVKYADITSGTLPAYNPVSVSYTCLGITNGKGLGQISFPAVDIQVNGCNTTTPSIQVPMGTVNSHSFSGPGSYGRSVPFTIGLDCQVDTKVSLTLGTSGSSDNVLPLNGNTGEQVASGLGIQILYDGNPLPLGAPTNLLDSTTVGANEIPMTARYYQTGVKITPGAANSVASFTLTYR